MNEDLIKKWRPILDYTDKDTPEIGEWQKVYLANLMENTEQYFMDNTNLLKVIIPQIRRNAGPLERIEIKDQQWDIVTVNGLDGNKKKYAINTEDVKIERGNHPAMIETYMSNCWKMVRDEWVWSDWR